ncbi:hypothetical protein L1I30_05345 [Gillisia sp. M10.2A]|uniref:Lipoprotein n=1 Tax=Gillisia lutea TaxID=2909668 RepID=A0ABS9EE03_9FLAO|nr:hypothetical protein [Gillisia lutea]MCF4101081.1 hypothetical protein [Gillisia lutea]
MMKKLALLFLCTLTLISCNVDDDGPSIVYEAAEVIDADLPEAFENGKTYEIEVTYRLPSACHDPAGIEVTREGTTGEKRRNIYVVGVGSRDANLTNCTDEATNLEHTTSFYITIDEAEPYTFNLWIGKNVDDENQYTTITVPVEEGI